MFITTGGDTALNKVSINSKTPEVNYKPEKEYYLTDVCPDICKNKNKIKINYKKVKKEMQEYLKSDAYARALVYWNRRKPSEYL